MTPDKRGHEPQYGSSRYAKEDRHNKLLAILGGSKPAPQWDGIAPGKGINLHQVCQEQFRSCQCMVHAHIAMSDGFVKRRPQGRRHAENLTWVAIRTLLAVIPILEFDHV